MRLGSNGRSFVVLAMNFDHPFRAGAVTRRRDSALSTLFALLTIEGGVVPDGVIGSAT